MIFWRIFPSLTLSISLSCTNTYYTYTQYTYIQTFCKYMNFTPKKKIIRTTTTNNNMCECAIYTHIHPAICGHFDRKRIHQHTLQFKLGIRNFDCIENLENKKLVPFQHLLKLNSIQFALRSFDIPIWCAFK